MVDTLTQDVKIAVDDVFKKKEEDTLRVETEKALNASAEKITELTSSFEAKDEEVKVLQTRVGELESTIAQLSDNKKELTEQLEQGKSEFEAKEQALILKVTEAETKLADFEKELRAKARFEELQTDGVAVSDTKAIKAQMAKILSMEDDEFAAYKAERVDLRKSILDELEASASADNSLDNSDTSTTADNTNTDLDADAASTNDVDNAFTDLHSMSAMLNIEQNVTEGTLSKYKKLGEALAEKYTK